VTQDDFQSFNPRELTVVMTRARQAVPGRAYALWANRAIFPTYWAAVFSGHARLARRAASRAPEIIVKS
jgi:hypothetical protein